MNYAERMILWHQFEQLRRADPNQADHYELCQNILASGYTSRYSEICPVIEKEEADEEMQQEVYDILGMFRSLHNLQVGGTWTPSDPDAAKFEGFDANEDAHHFFAGHLIDREGLYEESAPNKNSHSSASLPRYRRMLEEWKRTDRYGLSVEEAEKIITA